VLVFAPCQLNLENTKKHGWCVATESQPVYAEKQDNHGSLLHVSYPQATEWPKKSKLFY
jgi:hypothetical protein